MATTAADVLIDALCDWGEVILDLPGDDSSGPMEALRIRQDKVHDLIGAYTQQDLELDKLPGDVAIDNARIMGPMHVETVAGLACRSVLS